MLRMTAKDKVNATKERKEKKTQKSLDDATVSSFIVCVFTDSGSFLLLLFCFRRAKTTNSISSNCSSNNNSSKRLYVWLYVYYTYMYIYMNVCVFARATDRSNENNKFIYTSINMRCDAKENKIKIPINWRRSRWWLVRASRTSCLSFRCVVWRLFERIEKKEWKSDWKFHHLFLSLAYWLKYRCWWLRSSVYYIWTFFLKHF